MPESPRLGQLYQEVGRFRRELATAFQQAEQVVLELGQEMTRGDQGEGTRREYTTVRLDYQQAVRIRDMFLETWQTMSKEA